MRLDRHVVAVLLGRARRSKNTEYNEHEYFLAVETAFAEWEALQNAGR